MVAMYGFLPVAQAAMLDKASVTLGDSSPGAESAHTVLFNLGTALTDADAITVTYQAGFDLTGASATLTNANCTINLQVVTCDVNDLATFDNVQDYTMTISGVVNPSPAQGTSYDVTIATTGGESSTVKVYIIDAVTMEAHVPSSLTFAIGPVNAGETINGTSTTVTSEATSINFGSLTNQQAVIGQSLAVSTNAASGFVVTVQQDRNLTSPANSEILPFDGVAEWATPTGLLADPTTWGYLGLASDDNAVFATDNVWDGFTGTDAYEVMRHTGPADSVTLGAGLTYVAYSLQVSALQAAGDYSNNLTYICTPTF
jgi:hypothetical protein